MKIRGSVALCITLATVLLTSIFFMTTTSSSSSPSGYDPWLDYDDDGDIDFDDVVPMAMSYGTSGDPTKKVEVTNWPTMYWDTTIWYNEAMSPYEEIWSESTKAYGFSTLHILTYGRGLTGSETLTVEICGTLWNKAHTEGYVVPAYRISLTAGEVGSMHAITIPVPSETFTFHVYADDLTYGYIYLSFYLTWA